MLVAGSGKQTLRNALQRLQTLSVTSEAALLGSSNPCLIARQQSSSATSGSESINVAAKVFYDSSIQLSRREQQVYLSANSRQRQLPSVAEHGYLYGFTEKELEGANELVKRALSTRTADASQGQRFRNQQLLQRLGNDARDSGNSAVQVAMLTERIQRLAAHQSTNKQDTTVPRSLQIMTSRRKKLMQYMQRTNFDLYRVVLGELGLRPVPLKGPRHPPKVRAETHKQINERNRRLKKRTSRGDRGH